MLGKVFIFKILLIPKRTEASAAYVGMLETRRKQDEERLTEKIKRGSRGFALGTKG